MAGPEFISEKNSWFFSTQKLKQDELDLVEPIYSTKYSVLLENNAQEQLIFKHAISTVVSGRVGPHTDGRVEAKSEPRAQSGTSGSTIPGGAIAEPAGVAGD